MTPTAAKYKGRRFEQFLCKVFGKWWCNDEKSFYCNTGSGGRSTSIGGVFSGDISPCKSVVGPWPLSVEAKKSEQWNLTHLVLNYPGEPLWHYLGQCLYSARQSENNIPLLVCAANRQPPIVFFDTTVIHSYVPDFLKRFPSLFRLRIAVEAIPEAIGTKYHLRSLDQSIVPLSAFLTAFSRQDFQPEFVRRKQLQQRQRPKYL